MRKLTIWLTIVVAFIAGYVAGSLEPTTNAKSVTQAHSTLNS